LSLNNKSDKVNFESGESKISSVKQSLQDSIINLSAKSTNTDKIDFMKQFTEFGTQKDLKTDEANQLPNFIKSPTEMVLTKDKVDLQPVRFTLPDNINAQLKPNGKSVRINIEPNHLGPARLSLNMQNDKLSAVVTVHSAQAKMTVEGSLDRLLDALNKANIKVDYIDVNVNQENSYEQFAQSGSGYYKQRSNNNFSLSDYILNENNIIENVTPRGVSYVNANGVNLTA
ncbi:MAG: flagellar hook-length control protein FliK, partial [bacterium]